MGGRDMVIFWGISTCGQVDVVPKRFSVATEFFHIMYFPLLPVRSCVIFDQRPPEDASEVTPPAEGTQEAPAAAPEAANAPAEKEIRIRIPMSGKSVLLGYLRGWGFWLAVVCGFLGGMLWLMSGSDPEAAAMYPGFLWVALGGFIVAMASYYGPWNTASPARALGLCKAAGLDPAVLPDELRQAAADR